MSALQEGRLLWQPGEESKANAAVNDYLSWLKQKRRLPFSSYQQLWEWSVENIEDFWESIWHYFDIQSTSPYDAILPLRSMPGARWFPGSTLNYAEHVFRNVSSEYPALIAQSEHLPYRELSWQTLQNETAAIAQALRNMGVKAGDRVVAYLPNIPQAVIAFLACASIGAIWSSCSPDFGSASVIDRFAQIEPTVLFAVDGYQYAGKRFERRDVVAALQQALPTLRQTILVRYLDPDATANGLHNTVLWDELPREAANLSFEPLPFEHPLWVLYSSGTTGLPKPIVHGQGGVLLEHLKTNRLHLDLKVGDRFFWFSTTGWMMWNLLVGGLLVGATILLYDGSPGTPDMNALWRFAEQSRMSFFGTSASYISACMKAEIEPGAQFQLEALRGIGSTGSPLPPEGFDWIYTHVKADLWLASVSGGTDVVTAFVGSVPTLPVYAGELQALSLGANVQSWNEQGQPLIDEVGELVLTAPLPSMPLFFWNDPDMQRYRESYFEMFPGVWRHGDWIKITARHTAIIYGRSDATINRQGVRMGTSEFYRVVDDIPEVIDSLVIDLEGLGQQSFMPLFVVLRPGIELDDNLRNTIRQRIRMYLSPRHIPDHIYAIPDIPRTLSGKKLEVPIKKLFLGVPLEKAANLDSLKNPESLQFFVELAQSYMSANKKTLDRV